MTNTNLVTKTPDEWCSQYGLHILDPDGWRGTMYLPWETPLTIIDFAGRYSHCTVDISVHGLTQFYADVKRAVFDL